MELVDELLVDDALLDELPEDELELTELDELLPGAVELLETTDVDVLVG